MNNQNTPRKTRRDNTSATSVGWINPKKQICTKCGAEKTQIIGTNRCMTRAILAPILGTHVVNLFASETSPNIQFKCNKCKIKFTPNGKMLDNEDKLTKACRVTFYREKSIVGGLIPIYIYLNGKRIGKVDSGKTISFVTWAKCNYINVLDFYGCAFKDAFQFDAIDDGTKDVHFERGFK